MWTPKTPFAPPGDKVELEQGTQLTPKFDADGFIPVIAQEAGSGQVLMLAYMNAEALRRTIETGEAWYWSRSRKAFWRKGETSGNSQTVIAIATDCDQDTLLVTVRQTGPACHTGRKSCFYRTLSRAGDGTLTLSFTETSGG
ncbi:MAG TPA: phosphoribosyl-AMP cyclohydrolase [Beijerinckiaceae bacterium]|nr:phosphoribosyl-AMP cyclohydrolase [Beijerinckiaceae bacterium]